MLIIWLCEDSKNIVNNGIFGKGGHKASRANADLCAQQFAQFCEQMLPRILFLFYKKGNKIYVTSSEVERSYRKGFHPSNALEKSNSGDGIVYVPPHSSSGTLSLQSASITWYPDSPLSTLNSFRSPT